MQPVRDTIFIVEDNPTNLAIGRNMLKAFYRVVPLLSAAEFFTALETIIPDLILLDIEMPEMDGYEAIRKLKEDKRFTDIPVIFLTAKTDSASELEGLTLGAVDYITKPFVADLLLKRIDKELQFVKQKKELLEAQSALKGHLDNLEQLVANKTKEIVDLQHAIITTITDLVEFRDKLTGGHIVRTQLYLQALIGALVQKDIYTDIISGWDIELLLSSAQLHDVGKIGVSDAILRKPGRLTQEEFEDMKTHVTTGVDAIGRIINNKGEDAFLRYALAIAGTHHEKWDGTGYPTGLKGYDIPLEGRLMAIADVYDALISVRPYKKAFTHREATRIITAEKGTHFDPVLVDVFLSVEGEFERISLDTDQC